MSGSCKPKPGCFGSDIHRLLLAAEAGQRADILAYSSGHLGPRSLNQSQPRRGTKQSFWRMSQSQEETPNPLQARTKALVRVKKKEKKECPSEFSTGTALVECEVSRSRQDLRSSHTDRREDRSLPKIVHCASDSLPVQPRAFSQKKSNSGPEGKQQFCSSHSDQEGLNNEGQLKTKQRFGRRVKAKQNLWAGINVAEVHEKKLQKVRIVTQTMASRNSFLNFQAF